MLEIREYEAAVLSPRTKRNPAGLYVGGNLVEWSNSTYGKRAVWRDDAIEESGEAVVYLGNLWCAWGHLITDFSRHLWMLERLLAEHPGIRVVYSTGSRRQKLPQNFVELLYALGVRNGQLLEVKSPTRYAKVYFCDPSFNLDSGIGYTAEYVRTVERIIAGIVPHPVTPFRMVYFTRTGLTRRRKDFGEADVERAYAAAGFEIVRPERLTFAEMVQLLQETATLACTLGSVSHNALFLQKGARVEILRKYAGGNGYQDKINRIRELRVLELDVFPKGFRTVLPKEPWRGPFYIGVSDQLAEHLGCQPAFDVRERWRYRWCAVMTWLHAHRI